MSFFYKVIFASVFLPYTLKKRNFCWKTLINIIYNYGSEERKNDLQQKLHVGQIRYRKNYIYQYLHKGKINYSNLI